MKNIIASIIPTFSTKDNGEEERLFSNLINASIKKKTETPIIRSYKNFRKKVSGLP
jgi:hypothetical protein